MLENEHLAITKRECGFKYIRMHGLLTDNMAVYKEDRKENPQYNYMYVDALFDFLQSIGMKPFVELGFMPNGLASGPQTIFWWRGNRIKSQKQLKVYPDDSHLGESGNYAEMKKCLLSQCAADKSSLHTTLHND